MGRTERVPPCLHEPWSAPSSPVGTEIHRHNAARPASFTTADKKGDARGSTCDGRERMGAPFASLRDDADGTPMGHVRRVSSRHASHDCRSGKGAPRNVHVGRRCAEQRGSNSFVRRTIFALGVPVFRQHLRSVRHKWREQALRSYNERDFRFGMLSAT